MLIEDEPLAHELERQSGEKDQVGRIAGLDDRKAAFAVNLEQEPEFMKQRGRIFAEVSKRAAPLGRQRMPVDRNVVDDLEALRKVGVGRADHRHRPAGAMEGLSLLPNPSIEGDRQIFDDDDTGAGLARGRHGRPSIVGICGFGQGAATPLDSARQNCAVRRKAVAPRLSLPRRTPGRRRRNEIRAPSSL